MTTQSTNTPTPWRNSGPDIMSIGPNKGPGHWKVVAFVRGPIQDEECQANASRIVACVNACAGINPEAVPELLAILKTLSALVPSDEGLGGRAPIGAFYLIADRARAAIAKATP